MSSCEQSAETTLAIILGAQQWPQCPHVTSLPQAATAARNFETYLNGGHGLNLHRANVLNLFDSILPSSVMLTEAKDFILKRQADLLQDLRRAASDVFIYFAGHGDKVQPNNTYSLFVRSTDATQPASTSLSIVDLAELIRFAASDLRCYVILDACYSGAASEGFVNQSLNRIGEEAATPAFPRRGVSLFCSSSSGTESKAFQNNAYPMFTEALLESLVSGDATRGRRLSVREITELTIDRLKKKHNDLMVWPVIHSPWQFPGGPVSEVPIFPNPAYLPDTPKSDEIAKTIAQESFVKDQPYLLGQKYAGREQEQSDLTEWLEGRHPEFGHNKLFFICDYGGAGKTALVWNWAQSPATQNYLTANGIGYYWATFYAKNYSWRSFIHNLADQLKVKFDWERWHREEWKDYRVYTYIIDCLIERLREKPLLIILDGIEREMDAFDARGNQLLDSEEQDLRKEMGEVSREEQLFHSPLFARFLRRVLETKAKVMLTSRHVPEDLRGQDGNWLPGVHEYEFRPMSHEDAMRVWDLGGGPIDSKYQAKFFEAVDYHPQVIGVISSALKTLGFPSFEDWFNDLKLTDEERLSLFDPKVPLTHRRHLWIELGTRDILMRGVMDRLVLGIIVHQSDATEITQLENRLVDPANPKPFRSREELRERIKNLQSRWLLGVDFNSGTVDIHPVIRSQTLKYSRRQSELPQAEVDQEILQIASKVEGSIQSLFTQEEMDAIAAVLDYDEIRNLAELHGYTKTLNHYLGRFFPEVNDGNVRFLVNLPRLRYRKDQGRLLFFTASMHSELGAWTDAVQLYRRAALAYRLIGDYASVEDCERSQNWQALYGGSLLESERFRLDLLERERESPEQREVSCFWLALCMAIRRSTQTRELQDLLPVGKNRWTLQATAEACYYLGETVDYQRAEALAEAALQSKENMGLSEWLWELLALGLAQLRLGKVDDASACLQEVIDKGKRYSYPIIPLFAIAGYLEYLMQASQSKTRYGREMHLNEALQRYRFFEDGRFDQYQIPATEAHLTAARVYLERGNLDVATTLALKALEVARGKSFPFCYKGGEQRALDLLTYELKIADTNIPSVVPVVNEIELNQHEERIRRLIAKLKKTMSRNDSASVESESP